MPTEVKISPIGTMAGSIAASATYSSLVAISGTASTVVDIATETGGYFISKGFGKLIGPSAEIASGAALKILSRTTTSILQNYSPAVAGAAAAVVGVTTSLIVTGSEYLLRGAISKIQEKYNEQNGTIKVVADEHIPQLTYSEEIIKLSEIEDEKKKDN